MAKEFETASSMPGKGEFHRLSRQNFGITLQKTMIALQTI
jgi:hypothetical protein